jgi:hypothetical protein
MQTPLTVISETRLFGVPVIRRLAQTAKVTARPKLQALARVTDGTAQEPFKDSKLTFEKVRQILKDPAVKFCNAIMTAPISAVGLQVTGRDVTQVEFLKRVLLESGIVRDYMQRACTARYFGFYVAEVRYAKEGDQITLKPFKGLPPDRVRLVEDKETGELVSVKYQQPIGPFGTVNLDVADGKFLLVTYREHESESNRYGISDLEEVREWAFAKRFVKDMMLRWVETKADPSIGVSYYPPMEGEVASDGTVLTEAAVRNAALELAKSIRQGAPYAIPKDAEGRKLFEIEKFETSDRMPVFDALFKLCNLEIFHALRIPERAVSEGTSGTGSYSQAETHKDTLIQQQEDEATQLLQPLNDYTIQKLLTFNFPTPDPTAKVVHTGLKDADAAMIQMIAQSALTAATAGTPMAQGMLDWLREATGIPLDSRFLVPPTAAEPVAVASGGIPAQPAAQSNRFSDIARENGEEVFHLASSDGIVRRLLAAPKPSLRRALTAREAAMPGGERYFLAVNVAWSEMESGLFNDLSTIVAQQRQAFLNAVERALAATTKASRLKAVRDLGLGRYGAFESALSDGLSKAARFGLENLAKELRLKHVPDVASDTVSFVKTQAASSTEASLGKLLSQLRLQALNGVNQDQSEATVLKRVADIFDGYVEKSLLGDVVKQVSTAINYSRRQAERLELPDPLVSATRTSVMDAGTCEVCEFLDGQTVTVDDPHLGEITPPAGCMGGSRCHCILMYNQESMRPALRELDYRPLPAKLQEDVWY